METLKLTVQRLKDLFLREVEMGRQRPLYLFCMLIAPLFFCYMFCSLMSEGAPNDLPAALVDEDNTQVSRTIVRTLDAMQETNIAVKYQSFSEAKKSMQRGEVYAIFYIPEGTTKGALTQRQPKIYCYTNEAYFLSGSFLLKDLKLIGELSGLAITRETMQAKGYTMDQIMPVIQPISVETHALNNPSLNYSIYLTNMLVPGIILLVVFLATTYSIGLEWKRKSHKEWYEKSGNNVLVALFGKLLPQALVFMLVFVAMDVYLYKIQHFVLNCSMWRIIFIQILSVLASQGFAAAIFGILAGQMRMAMSVASLLGVLSVSLSGFTFPVMAMPKLMQSVAWCLPLRHYFLLYVSQVLNGFPLMCSWKSIAILLTIAALPLLFIRVYRYAFENVDYKA